MQDFQDRDPNLPRSLREFFFIAISVNLIGVVCECIARYVFHLGWPYNSPLLDDVSVTDLRFAVPLFQHVHSAEFFASPPVPFMYPAALAPLFGFFLALPHPLFVFEFTLAAVLIAAAIGFGLFLRRTGLPTWKVFGISCGALALSYPAFFELKQGNVELFVCLIVGAGVWRFSRGRLHTAAACFGVAAAMKIFPVVYVALFIARRRYRPLVAAGVAALIVTLGSLSYLGPSIPAAAIGIARNLNTYQHWVPLAMRREIGYDHSLFAGVKYVMVMLHHGARTIDFTRALRLYMLLAACAGVALYFLRIRLLPVANQIICLCVASIFLPPVSFDYTLLHLYVPWALLVLFALRNGDVAGLRPMMWMFALATSIETEFIWHGRTVGGQVKGVALLGLLVLALLYPLKERRELPPSFAAI